MKKHFLLTGLVSIIFLVVQTGGAFASSTGELSVTKIQIASAPNSPALIPQEEIAVSATPAVFLNKPVVAGDDLIKAKTGETPVDSRPESNSAPVPEPATMLLFGTGIAGLFIIGRKRTRRSSGNHKTDWNF